jgi:peptidylprolyl isomerase
MRRLLAFGLLAFIAPAAAQEAEPPTPASIVAAAPASDWRPIEPADLLVMDLVPDRDGNPRRVIIQLLPPPFSQGWVENVRTLARAHWWDGTSVYRVVDNWVAQWGDADETKPLPEGLRSVAEAGYAAPFDIEGPGNVAAAVRAEAGRMSAAFSQWRVGDDSFPRTGSYAGLETFVGGWPIAADDAEAWPVHCYGSVGVARSTDSTGTGSELYAVIGHAPRQLDRNIAVVGRVIEGIEHLSTLPRGKGEAGVYDDPALRVPIVSVRLGNEVPEFPQPRFEYLASDSASFADYVRVRANRNDAFYKVPAGGVDVCNVQVPIRRAPSE